MQNKKLFLEYMAGLGELHNKELSSVLIDMYWKSLEPFSDEQCKVVFDKAVVKYRFFPKPADLVGDMDAPTACLAQQQVVYFMNAVTGREYRNPEGWDEDPTTKRLLEGRFNVDRIREDSLESDHKWIEKNFIEAYNDSSEYVDNEERLKLDAPNEVKQLAQRIG